MKKLLLSIGIIILFSSANLAQDKTLTVKFDDNTKSLIENIKEGEKPVIYIDGKKYDYDIVDLIDQNKIASVSVYKGEEAMKKFNSPKVISIITKNSKDYNKVNEGITIRSNSESSISVSSNTKKDDLEEPIIVIDGKPASKKELKNLSPDDIYAISVFKDEKSLKNYNTNKGVILVTTKKANNKAENKKNSNKKD